MESPSIIFTTAYVDIGRGDASAWKDFSRTHEKYIEHFNNMIHDGFEYRLIVYTHTSVIEHMQSTYTYASNIQFVPLDGVDTFLKEPYITRETAIMQDPLYKKNIRPCRSDHISYTQPKYTLLTHSKMCFLRHTRQLYQSYTYYAWIDFGYPKTSNILGWPVCTIPSGPRSIDVSLLEKKIHFGAVKLMRGHVHEYDFLLRNYFTIYAFSFILHTEIFDEVYKLYVDKLHKWQRIGIADDEQNLFYQLFQDRKDLCKMFLIQSVWGLYPEVLNQSARATVESVVLHPKTPMDALYTPPAGARCSSELDLMNFQKPLVICYDTDATSLQTCVRTLDAHNWEYICVGHGEPVPTTSKYVAYLQRVLNCLPASKQIVLVNGRDAVCCRSPSAFMSAIADYKRSFIVSMEMLCEGQFEKEDTGDRYQCKPLNTYWRAHGMHPPLRKFVNYGLLTATVSEFCEYLAWSLENGHTVMQYALGCYMAEYPERISADVNAALLHTTNFGVHAGMQDIQKQKHDSPTFAELFGRAAFFLQFPGRNIAGTQLMYETTVRLLEAGASDRTFREKYSHPEPSWTHTLA